MRPTAEGLEENEKRDKPKHESVPKPPEAEKPAEPAAAAPPPVPFPDLPSERYVEEPSQPFWLPETTSPLPEPVFVESEMELAVPSALPAEEPRFEEPRFDEDDDEEDDDEDDDEELGAAEAATGTDSEEKDSEGRSAESRRRRSRGRRGGRRRNGRTAAGTAETVEEEDSEEPLPFDEPAPIAPIVAPAPAPRRRSSHTPAPSHAPVHAPTPAPTPGYRVRGTDSYVITQSEHEPVREIVISVPDRQRSAGDERKIALFCDFENIAFGVRDSDIGKFDINLVLERLLEKGKIIVKKAYADWERYSDYKRPFHEAAIELIDIPQKF